MANQFFLFILFCVVFVLNLNIQNDLRASFLDRLVVGQVLRIVYREPNDENRRKAAPKHNHQTGKWECDFCKRDTFNTEMDAKAHSDIANPGKDCPGMPIGAVVRLHCGLTAFVLNKNMSDNFDNIRDPLKLLPVCFSHSFSLSKPQKIYNSI